MTQFSTNYNLLNYNTFKLNIKSSYFAAYNSGKDIKEIIEFIRAEEKNYFVLGGGSNVLFSKDFQGLIIHPVNSGIRVIEDNNQNVLLNVAAGENWDHFVEWAVSNNLYGIENLSWIPGNVGAAPVQNIGAYGFEAKDRIEKVEGYNLKSGEHLVLTNKECDFGYRNSIFKNELRNQVLITSVYFRLEKSGKLKLDYPLVNEEVERLGSTTLKTVRQAIINIRKNKLPDPEALPNAGSFFKNPILPSEQIEKIKALHPEMPVYPAGPNYNKTAAGWLIDQCGWKGKSHGNAAVHKNQALVLINKNQAEGKELLKLAEMIKKSVYERFGIMLEEEVNIL